MRVPIAKNKLHKFVTSLFFRFSIVLSSFVIFLISSHLYGPEGRGVISFVGSFFYLLSLLFSFGIGRVAYQKISHQPESARVFLPAAVSFIYLVTLIGFVSIALCIAFFDLSNFMTSTVRPFYFLLLYGIFPYNLWLLFSNYLFSSVRKTERHEIFIFLSRLTQILLLAGLALTKGPLDQFLTLYGISGFLIFIFESRILLSGEETVALKEGLRHIKSLLVDIKWPYVDSLAQAAVPLVVLLIGMKVTSIELGNYHFSLQIITTLLFPFFVMQVKIQEILIGCTEKARTDLLKGVVWKVPALGIVMAIVGLIIPYFLPKFGFSSFSESVVLLRVLLFSIPLQGLNIVLQGVWVGLHRPRFSLLVNLFQGGISLIVALLFVNRLGVWSGVVGIFVASSLVLIGQFAAIYELTRSKLNPARSD